MESSASPPARVLVLGMDGLDWELLHPLLDAGRLPHPARLVDHGSIATLAVPQPLLAPLLWTTVATGQPAPWHGILHARFPDPADLTGRRDQSAGVPGRLAPTLWELATAAGLRAHVIGWPATFPAESTAGVFLSDGLPLLPEDPSDGPSAPPPSDQITTGPTSAPDLAEALAEFRVRPGEIALSDLRARRAGPRPGCLAGTTPGIAQLAASLAAAASRHAAATWVLESEPHWHVALLHSPFPRQPGPPVHGLPSAAPPARDDRRLRTVRRNARSSARSRREKLEIARIK